MNKVQKSWDYSGWRRLRGNLINEYKYLKGRWKEEGARLFSVMLSDKMRQKAQTETWGFLPVHEEMLLYCVDH